MAAAVLCGRWFDGIRGRELCQTPTAAGPPPHPPRAGCHFPPRPAASSQPRARGRDQRGGGGASLPARRAAELRHKSRRALPGKALGGCPCEQRRDTAAWEAPDQSTERTRARRLPGVSRPARGLLAFLPERRNRLCASGRVSATGEQKQSVDTEIMRSQVFYTVKKGSPAQLTRTITQLEIIFTP